MMLLRSPTQEFGGPSGPTGTISSQQSERFCRVSASSSAISTPSSNKGKQNARTSDSHSPADPVGKPSPKSRGTPEEPKRATSARSASFRDRYSGEEKRIPSRTWWIANPFRTMDPSDRPAPDSSVGEKAADIGAVHVLATDLYKLWARVARGELSQELAAQQLIDAAPGLWSPGALVPGKGT